MKSHTPYLTAIILLCLLTACNLNQPSPQTETVSLLPGQPDAETILVAAPSNATPTPTAFQPLATAEGIVRPTATVNPDNAFPLPTSADLGGITGNYPPPSISPPIALQPPVALFPQPDNQVNFLLLGSDQRPYSGGYRTDSIILVTLNFENKTASLTSFPRDLYVYIPGWTIERINTAQLRGGFDLTAETFAYNFGVRPEHYALINFNGFMSLVDFLGGIDVQVAQTLTDHRDAHGQYTVWPGTVRMDGETALWYVRSRYTTSDFDRARRQQEVLAAIFFRLISLDIVAKTPELYQQFSNAIETDMSLEDILGLLPFAADFAQGDRITNYLIGAAHVQPWTNPYNGAQVLLQDRQAILSVMEAALNVP